MSKKEKTLNQSGNSALHKANVSGSVCRITKSQVKSIQQVIGDMEAMLGCGDDDSHWRRHIKNMERFLINNGLS